MDADDRARLRAHADDYENGADVHALLDHIDQLEAQLAEARATKNMHKDRYEELSEHAGRVEAQVRRVRDVLDAECCNAGDPDPLIAATTVLRALDSTE